MAQPSVASAESTTAAIDWAKALAILAVLVTHAGPFAFGTLEPIDYVVRVVAVAFHVPVFLLVSGYLHASATPLTLGRTWARLRRVLGPYVVASLVVTVCGLTREATWRHLPWNLAFGAAVPIYYYVLVWCGCVVTGLLWSRLSASVLLIALGCVVIASEWRAWHPTWNFFWGVRDPLLQGWLLCYLGGWCARRFGWLDVVMHYRVASVILAIGGSVPWLFRPTTTIATDLRLLYSASVAMAIVALMRAAPQPIRWLSRETLWIYLAHLPVLEVVLRYAKGWPPIPRISFAVSVTLGVCVVAILLGRRIQSWRGIPPVARRAA